MSTQPTEQPASVGAATRDHADRIRKEYASWVAIQPIDINGARAFNPGDAVPLSHVEKGVVRGDQVAKRGTKAAEAVGATNPTTEKG